MATVPTNLLDELTDEVNRLSGSAQDAARSALTSILDDWERNGGGDVAALREAAYEAIEDVLNSYADTYAAARAAEYYDAVRKAQGFPGSYSAVAESLRNPDATLGAVRAFVGKVAEGKAQAFLTLCLQRIDTETRRAANKCVAYNASKDPAKPWYGRVPRGETCGFCLMLASFGFYAKTVAAAEHAHPNCDCRIVPGFPGETTVKDYDPDGMYERYDDCLNALGGRDGIARGWYAMPKEERDARVARHGGKSGEAYQAYVNSRVASEIETRDANWYKTGKPVKALYEDGANALPKEESLMEILLDHGYPVTFRATRSGEHLHTSDLLIGETSWEIKQPIGSGSQTIFHQFEEAAVQSNRLILDAREIVANGGRDLTSVENEAARKLWWHYKSENGETMQFDEVMIVTDDYLRKIKRGS